MSEFLSGSRFLRGYCCPGGVKHDLDDPMRRQFLERIERVRVDLEDVMRITFGADTVRTRMEHVGVLSTIDAGAMGIVGPAARASGVPCDVRRDFPRTPYRGLAFEPIVESGGDVAARTRMRQREIGASIALVNRILSSLPDGPIRTAQESPRPGLFGIGQVEAWRGEIVTAAMVDEQGAIRRVRFRDPSIQNWIGLALAVESAQVSDFPLCNKSFNLSYSGTDL
jgi:Ni,Fe-hydrogenase III large subunit